MTSYTVRHWRQEPTGRPVGQLTRVLRHEHHVKRAAAVADFEATVAVARPGERVTLDAVVES